MAIQTGFGRGEFFSKSRMCQYPGKICYILWIQKCIFDACRQLLHNSGLICNQATALCGAMRFVALPNAYWPSMETTRKSSTVSQRLLTACRHLATHMKRPAAVQLTSTARRYNTTLEKASSGRVMSVDMYTVSSETIYSYLFLYYLFYYFDLFVWK